VRVKKGPFEGVEGTVIRVKRSRRVMVELPGMLAIATTFVKPEELEIL
jgi:transcription antitermination factor NusG